MLTDKDKENIKLAFDKKVHDLTCPMCKNKAFTMADGYFVNNMQKDINSINLGGQAIPTIGIICNNCGFVSQHALGALGILENLKKKKEDEPTK
jgi:hypothetical protein